MKVLILGPVSPKLGGAMIGGISKHVEGLTVELASNEHSVFLWYHRQTSTVVPFSGATVLGECRTRQIIAAIAGLAKVFRYVSKEYKGLLDLFVVSYQYSFLNRLLKRHSFDAIHVHSLNSTAGFVFELLSPRVKLPRIVFTDHGFWHKVESGKFSYKYLINIQRNIKMADRVVYISQFSKVQLEKYKLFSKKFHFIPNPIENAGQNEDEDVAHPELIDFLNSNKNRALVFFNGFNKSLTIKRIDLLVEAIKLSEYLKNQVCVVCICDAEGRSYIQGQADDLHILVLDKQPINVIRFLYQRSACLVNPSNSESYGLVYMEALSFGKPVVGFTPVISEFSERLSIYIGEGIDPLNDPYPIPSLTAMIKKVLSTEFEDSEIKHRMLDFTWSASIKAFEDVYR